tara:strand:+ start:150 stop:416 length:267 start_codon:yes stop_codon:yes gene_type:complete
MKNWLNLNNNIPWENQKNTTENSNPVNRYTDNPSQWEVTGSRVIFNCYGEGQAIDIRIMETDSDKQHQVNITVGDDGKLKARVSEQIK